MPAAENNHRRPRPAGMRFIIGEQNIVRSRRLAGIVFHLHAVVIQQRGDKHRQSGVVNGKPAAFFRQAIGKQRRAVLHAIQRNADGKAAAHAGLGFHGNIAIHHADELLANRQPEARSLEIALNAGTDLEERVKQAHHLFCRDPFPGIAHADLQIVAGALNVQDNAAGIGEFDGIAQEVRNDLLQTHRIAGHQLRNVGLNKAVQPELLAHHQRQIVRRDVVHHLARRELARLDFQLLGLNFREIQNIADDLQQQAGRVVHRRDQTVDALRQLFGLQQIEVADNSVQRRSQLVAHRRKEHRFRLAGLLCGLRHLLQRLFHFDASADVNQHADSHVFVAVSASERS
nr:Uncharacterised protein [Raoultella sp. NCTC 9187]